LVLSVGADQETVTESELVDELPELEPLELDPPELLDVLDPPELLELVDAVVALTSIVAVAGVPKFALP